MEQDTVPSENLVASWPCCSPNLLPCIFPGFSPHPILSPPDQEHMSDCDLEEPALLKYRSSNWFILLTVCFASFSVSNYTWTFRSVYSLAHTFFRTHSYTAWYVPIAFPNRHHRSSRSKIVPVLPFSLKTRSGIDEEHSKLHRAGTVIYEFAWLILFFNSPTTCF